MQNGIFKLDWANVRSAIVYGLLWGAVAMLAQVQSAGSIFNLDWKGVIDAGVIAGIGVVISVVKNMFTTNSGNFLGVVKTVSYIE